MRILGIHVPNKTRKRKVTAEVSSGAMATVQLAELGIGYSEGDVLYVGDAESYGGTVTVTQVVGEGSVVGIEITAAGLDYVAEIQYGTTNKEGSMTGEGCEVIVLTIT